MSVLYITKPGTVLSRHNGRLQIHCGGKCLQDLPLETVGRIALLAPTQINAAVMNDLLRRNIPVLYFSMKGSYRGILASEPLAVSHWIEQFSQWQNPDYRLQSAIAVAKTKIANQRNVLLRYARNHQEEVMRDAAMEMRAWQKRLETCTTLDMVRGMEGMAARLYFGAFSYCLRSKEFTFQGRNRRPPRDPVNAMLSLGYMMLLGEVVHALIAEGLHPGLGFFHEPSDRRPALALDVMEVYRQTVVDKFVLALVNRGQVKADDFYDTEDLGVRLSEEFLSHYLQEFETRMSGSVNEGIMAGWRSEIRNTAADLRRKVHAAAIWKPTQNVS